jgi:hypothetical protein
MGEIRIQIVDLRFSKIEFLRSKNYVNVSFYVTYDFFHKTINYVVKENFRFLMVDFRFAMDEICSSMFEDRYSRKEYKFEGFLNNLNN